ncbi:MAG TPA: hypothetical protein VII06_29975 [Chloroflexota bacterium]|jgi:hypothetical protein
MATVDTARDVTEYPLHWGREGFVGEGTQQRYAYHPTDYTAVDGPHAPHCLNVANLVPPDRDDPAALPLPIMAARSGLRVSVSGRAALMPFVLTNVEADEIHFVQAGELVFWTDYGPLTARAGDFVCLPRAIALLYSLSARRSGRRPPVHRNADYDEVIYYFAGPDAYGRVNEPGTLTWVPKGIAHHGPTEAVPQGYLAWLLESRSTLRLTPAGLAAASLMETDGYGPFEANRASAR